MSFESFRKKFNLPDVVDFNSINVTFPQRSRSHLKKIKKRFNSNRDQLIVYKNSKRAQKDETNQRIHRHLRKLKYLPLDRKYYLLMESKLKEDDDKVIVTFNTYDIKVSDLKRLCGNNWLNDNIINYYISLLEHRQIEHFKQFAHLRCFFFNSYFYSKLLRSGHSGVKKWTKKKRFKNYEFMNNIFDADKVLFPVCVANNHWFCCCINIKGKAIECYDSYNDVSDDFFTPIENYLKLEYKDKIGCKLDISDWIRVNGNSRYPQQQNFYDCGVFMLKCADWLSDDLYPDYSQADVKYFRKRIMTEIILKKTLD